LTDTITCHRCRSFPAEWTVYRTGRDGTTRQRVCTACKEAVQQHRDRGALYSWRRL
jgi:hypothetical protein